MQSQIDARGTLEFHTLLSLIKADLRHVAGYPHTRCPGEAQRRGGRPHAYNHLPQRRWLAIPIGAALVNTAQKRAAARVQEAEEEEARRANPFSEIFRPKSGGSSVSRATQVRGRAWRPGFCRKEGGGATMQHFLGLRGVQRVQSHVHSVM